MYKKNTVGSQFADDQKLLDLVIQFKLGRSSRPTPTYEQVVEHETRLIGLKDSDLGKRVLKEWKIDALYGYSSATKETTEAVKLTNKISGQSMAFLKCDIQDVHKTSHIVKRLSIIGELERSYIRFFLNYLNAVRGIPGMITEVKDLTLVISETSLNVGRSVLDYYLFFLEDYLSNPDKYPTKSSNEYVKNVSHGVILDNDPNEYTKNEWGYYPVAIRTGKLKALFPYMDNKEYGKIIHRLAHLGVFHESISTRIVEGKAPFKTKFKMVEEKLEREQKGNKKYHDSVYIFNIIPSLFEGGI